MSLYDFDIPEITKRVVDDFEEVSRNELAESIVEFFKQHPDLPPTEGNIFKKFSDCESSLTPEVLDRVIQKLQPEVKNEKLVKWTDLMGHFWRSTISNWTN